VILSLLLVACEPESGAPSDRPPFDFEPDDTGGEVVPPPTDVDNDGWTAKDGDCDDGNASVFPGAYDRPNDGIDEDCADADRTCDCVILDAGTTASKSVEGIDTSAFRSLDLAYLLDTRAGSSALESWAGSFPDVADALETNLTDTTAGLARFDDYAYGDFGSAFSGDTPFQLLAQQSDDLSAMQQALNSTGYHGGADSTEAVMEGLYQALTGVGYDQDCDATYDGSTDVKPFIANPADPFGGLAGQFYDSTDQSTGNVGGMGFRAGSTARVIMYATDSYVRDPSAGSPTPGGCPGDAGTEDVVAAAAAAGVYLVGFSINSTLPYDQMLDLADATGSFADLDGDGHADDPLVYQWFGTTDELGEMVIGALHAIEVDAGIRDVYTSVWLEVRNDPL
jgi:hypothetical protein